MRRGPWALQLTIELELHNTCIQSCDPIASLPLAWTHINLVIVWAYISFWRRSYYYCTFFFLCAWRTRTNWSETRIVITQSKQELYPNKIRPVILPHLPVRFFNPFLFSNPHQRFLFIYLLNEAKQKLFGCIFLPARWLQYTRLINHFLLNLLVFTLRWDVWDVPIVQYKLNAKQCKRAPMGRTNQNRRKQKANNAPYEVVGVSIMWFVLLLFRW